jgi:hypothetical protein
VGLYSKDEQNHWHVKWDWHAGMWAVVPPAWDTETDVQFFFHRHEAFEEVERQLVSAPAEDNERFHEDHPHVQLPAIESVDDPFIPAREAATEAPPEPPRLYGGPHAPQPVYEDLTPREARQLEYQQRVGFK